MAATLATITNLLTVVFVQAWLLKQPLMIFLAGRIVVAISIAIVTAQVAVQTPSIAVIATANVVAAFVLYLIQIIGAIL